jgi:hypothetical protein
MKKIIKVASFTILVVGLAMSSCKKKSKAEEPEPTPDPDETAVFNEQSSDVSTQDNTMDLAMEDAEYAMSPSSMAGKGTAVTAYTLCNATIDTTQIGVKKITITYNGNSCDNGRNRSGNIVIQLVNGTKWADAGAVLKITYNNFKVTRLSNNKSMTFNGTHFITNYSGGIVTRIGFGSTNTTTIIRRLRGFNLNITFDDGTTRTWSVARTRTWTGANGIATSLTIAGDTSMAGVNFTEVWGTNRAGKIFTTVANTPIYFTKSCGWFLPIAGKRTHTVNGRVSTLTFGLDANGAPGAPASCPNHYLVTWTSALGVYKTYLGTY